MMYGLGGGACSGYFHLAVKNFLLVLALSAAGFIQYASASGTPGDQGGTQAILEAAQKQLVKEYPWLPAEAASLRENFDKLLTAEPSEEQVRKILSILEPCTDMTAKEVLSDPAQRREAAWLIYLDVYVREGPKKAEQLFYKRGSPPKGG